LDHSSFSPKNIFGPFPFFSLEGVQATYGFGVWLSMTEHFSFSPAPNEIPPGLCKSVDKRQTDAGKKPNGLWKDALLTDYCVFTSKHSF
jgi:hypothetical protein